MSGKWRAAAGVALGLLTLASAGGAELAVGDPAPDFSLQGSDGKTYKLADFKGKQMVVVAWFPKAFTGGWTRECASLRVSALDQPLTVKLLRGEVQLPPSKGSGLDRFNAMIFTASCDTPETNKRYAQALKLDYPILSDPQKKVAEAYGVVHAGRPVPERWTFYIGKDGKILHIDKAVKAGSHGAAVAAQLEKLGAEKK